MAHISVLEDLQNSLHEVKSAYPAAKIFLGRDLNLLGSYQLIGPLNGSITDSDVSTSFRLCILY